MTKEEVIKFVQAAPPQVSDLSFAVDEDSFIGLKYDFMQFYYEDMLIVMVGDIKVTVFRKKK